VATPPFSYRRGWVTQPLQRVLLNENLLTDDRKEICVADFRTDNYSADGYLRGCRGIG
jgi:hypothetical protein